MLDGKFEALPVSVVGPLVSQPNSHETSQPNAWQPVGVQPTLSSYPRLTLNALTSSDMASAAVLGGHSPGRKSGVPRRPRSHSTADPLDASLVMTSVLQKFDLSFDDPSYTLQIKQTLTVKPLGLYIRATPRSAALHLFAPASSALMTGRDSAPAKAAAPVLNGAGLPFYVLYGSNTGTSEAFAQRIAGEAPSYGAFWGSAVYVCNVV